MMRFWRASKCDEGGIANEDRADWGQTAFEAYLTTKGGKGNDDTASHLGDLMADLLHFAAVAGCIKNTADVGMFLERARYHFDAER